MFDVGFNFSTPPSQPLYVDFKFAFSLPFWNEVFKNLSCLHGKYAKEVGWELNTYLVGGDEFIKIETTLKTKCDHAGLNLQVALFGLSIEYSVYDIRHWNDDEDRWYLQGEEQREFEEYQKKQEEWKIERDKLAQDPTNPPVDAL
jgi:hypothetical protein